MNRQNLISGPALCTFQGLAAHPATFYSKDDIQTKINQETVWIEDSAFGRQRKRVTNVDVEATATPEGRWHAYLFNALWPYANAQIGSSIFSLNGAAGTDTPLRIDAQDGELVYLPCAGITKMGSITLSATKTIVGAFTFKGILANGGTWATVASATAGRYFSTTGASFTDSTYDPGLIPVQQYNAAWGTVAGFTSSFDTENGWTIDFDLELQPIGSDGLGILDYRIKSVGVMAKCIPSGISSANMLAAIQISGAGAARGRDLAFLLGGTTLLPDLVISGVDGTTVFTIKNATLETEGFRFGSTTLRPGEIGFFANRSFTAGVQNPLWTMAGTAS